LRFVARHFADHGAAVDRLLWNPDFRELCEDLAYMYRLDDGAQDASARRRAELRESLEKELREWLGDRSDNCND